MQRNEEIFTLTGAPPSALTTKEAAFLEDPEEGFGPNLCLAAPTEEVKEDETRA